MAEHPRIEELRRRVQADPASIAFAALAEEYRRAGRFEEAIEACRTGLQRHPSYLSARVTLGRSLLEVQQYGEARTELEYVLKAAPENLAAIRALAEIHERRGDHSETLEHYSLNTVEETPAVVAVAPAPPAVAGAPVSAAGPVAVAPVISAAPAAAPRIVVEAPAPVEIPAPPPKPQPAAPVVKLESIKVSVDEVHSKAMQTNREAVAALERFLVSIQAARRSAVPERPGVLAR